MSAARSAVDESHARHCLNAGHRRALADCESCQAFLSSCDRSYRATLIKSGRMQPHADVSRVPHDGESVLRLRPGERARFEEWATSYGLYADPCDTIYNDMSFMGDEFTWAGGGYTEEWDA